MSTEEKKSIWYCATCHHQYKSCKDYAKHLDYHEHFKYNSQQFPFICQLCCQRFPKLHHTNPLSYMQHLHSKQHQWKLLTLLKTFYCFDCCSMFENRRGFVNHLKSKQHYEETYLLETNRTIQTKFKPNLFNAFQVDKTIEPGQQPEAKSIIEHAGLEIKQNPSLKTCPSCHYPTSTVYHSRTCWHGFCENCLIFAFTQMLEVDSNNIYSMPCPIILKNKICSSNYTKQFVLKIFDSC